MKEKITIYDVARAAGVSPASVSRVFNRDTRVGEAVRERVLSAAQELGYRPTMRANRKVATLVVGDVQECFLGSYANVLLTCVPRELAKHGVTTEIVFEHDYEPALGASAVVIGLVHQLAAAQRIAAECGAPALMVNTPVEGAHSVCSDHAEGMRLAVRHLVERGHRGIGLFVRSRGGWWHDQRIDGFRTALEAEGVEQKPGLIETCEGQEPFEAVAKLLRFSPSAIIACGEDAALPALYVLGVLGKRVPEDVSLIGYDSPAVSPYLLPPMTCIAQDLERLALETAHAALKLIDGDSDGCIDCVIPSRLAERESVTSRHVVT